MVIMNYNLDLTNVSNKNSLKILKSQFYKMLPIFEGKDINKNIFYNKEVAFNNFQKHLSFLNTKVLGAINLYDDNQYYIEMAMLLKGMCEYTKEDHDKLKMIIFHCMGLIDKMIDGIDENA